MKQYLQHDPWRIIEEQFHPDLQRVSESIFSLGNGWMGHRGNFEESYTGDSLQGHYVAGVYYPDKTRVGWWKNGYPEHYAKVVNAPAWIDVDWWIDGAPLDLHTAKVDSFRRELNMEGGYLRRECTVRMTNGVLVQVTTTRLCSMARAGIGAVRYELTPLNFSSPARIALGVDGDIRNKDANYGEQFWQVEERDTHQQHAWLVAATKKTDFKVATAIGYEVDAADEPVAYPRELEQYAGFELELQLKEGQSVTVYKYAAIRSSLQSDGEHLLSHTKNDLASAMEAGFETLLMEQAQAWQNIWTSADIRIDGDVAAQQGIRFNIFQLYQTYTGDDPRLNIGPKGFTGEKYGGGTYWDTEAFCLPFYLCTAPPRVARQLLLYRYQHLPAAIENAKKLGFEQGAALYPMVTMDGSESHNEWEITFEEIHRNGAIAYAIYDYIRYTQNQDYMRTHGLEVLIAIARFWSQRVHWSEHRQAFMLHGVTGPNEYENNVNNNWYTNYIARWCLQYTLEQLRWMQQTHHQDWQQLRDKIKFYEHLETDRWQKVIEGMYLPENRALGIFVQHDGFLDKELLTVADLDEAVRPLHQHWSWDRILRSVFIKQADVLQGLYFFEDHFTEEQLRRNMAFYGPRTVHESSLSPSVHAILAARIGDHEKAYAHYLRTARLDLDNYNHDTDAGCHITSMAGTWMAIVKGFGGQRIIDSQLVLDPFLPSGWTYYTFRLRYLGRLLCVEVDQDGPRVSLEQGEPLKIRLADKELIIA